MIRSASLLLLILLATVTVTGQEVHHYDLGVEFPKPTALQIDSLLRAGIVPRWLEKDPYLFPMYWPRSAFSVVGRLTRRSYMTQALESGLGSEGNIAVPFGHSDYGLFLFARANGYRVLDRDWLRWNVGDDERGVLFNGGAGVAFLIPLRHPQFSIPLTMSVGGAFFQSEGESPAETYVSFEPGIGGRYRITPALSLQFLGQAAWMVSVADRPRSIGSWNFSLGLEVSLALRHVEPLPFWVPPLVVNAQDVIKLMAKELIPEVNILDRNLDFINTELKPLVAFGWYDLGFFGRIRGTVVSSSRASSGNVTALDIQVDSADRRGFLVWRTATLVNRDLARNLLNQVGAGPGTETGTLDSIVLARIRRGEYAFRSAEDFGIRYLRVELFPQAKGPVEKIPKVGSKVEISGDLRWDGDGHVELHPRNPNHVKIVEGQFLDTDDPPSIE